LVLVITAYWPALQAGFIWDDDHYVTDNPMLTAPDGLRQIWFSLHKQSQYFPLVFTTFRLERGLWGLKPWGYHLVNVLLHGVNAALAWAILRRLAVPGAWLAAALFAVHPVQVESVAWVTELKNLESMFFSALAVLAWMRFIESDSGKGKDQSQTSSQEPGRGDATQRHVKPPPIGITRNRFIWTYYLASLVAFLLALLAKTTACTLPAALLLVLWLKREPISWRRVAQIVPYVLLGLGMGLVSVFWEWHLGNYNPSFGLSFRFVERLLIAARAYWFYTGKLVWPAGLTFSYPRWEIAAGQPLQYAWLVAWLLVGFSLWVFRRRSCWRDVVAALLFFAATLSPLVGWISNYTFVYSFVADHYQYVASLGLLALVPGAIARVGSAAGLGRQWQYACGVALLAVLGALTWKRAEVYHDSERLWRDTVAKNPRSWLGYTNLGMALASQGRWGEAQEQYQNSLEVNPEDAVAQGSLGAALWMQQRRKEAVEHYRAAIRIDPNYAPAQANLGLALLQQSNYPEAISHLRRALEADPDFHSVLINLGDALRASGQIAAATEYYRKAAAAMPNRAEPLAGLGGLMAREGDYTQSVAAWRQALVLAPGRADFWMELGHALLQQTNYDEAVSSYRRAAALDPNNALVQYNLGVVLRAEGRLPEAELAFREALRLKPDFVEAQEQMRRLPDRPAK
jgi:tetratricopeptide (TPR) repeat protein